MFVKKFEASSLDEALSEIKNTLGPDALILSTKEKPRGLFRKTHWEVTAAAEKRAANSPSSSELDEAKLREIFPHRAEDISVPLVPGSVKKAQISRYTDSSIEQGAERPRKIRHVERFLELGFSPETAKDFGYQLQYEHSAQDVENPRRLEKIQFRLFTNGIKFLKEGFFETATDFMVIGPNGSGKTSLLVKLAIFFRRKGKRVRLVSLDERKLMGRPELEAYAKRLAVPFGNYRESNAGEIHLWDSPGLSHTQSENNHWESEVDNKAVILVLDAGLRLAEMMRWKAKVDHLNVKAVIFTKLDEIKDKAILFDFLKKSGLPLLGISASHSFRTPFKFLDPQSWVRMLLRLAETTEV